MGLPPLGPLGVKRFTPLETKMRDIVYPSSDQIQNLIPFLFRPETYSGHTLNKVNRINKQLSGPCNRLYMRRTIPSTTNLWRDIAIDIFTYVHTWIYIIYIEDITRWREDMNFMFEWQKRYLTSERSERVRCRFCHENIKFISLS